MRKITVVSLQKFGGGAADALEFSNGLSLCGIPHSMIISDANELSEFFHANGKRSVFKVKTFSSKIQSFLFHTLGCLRPFHLLRIIRRTHPDVIYVTHRHPWIPLLFLYRKFFDVKILVVAHDNPFSAKEVGGTIENALEKFCIKHADAIVAHSKFVKEGLGKYVRDKGCFVFPLGPYYHVKGCVKDHLLVNNNKLTFAFVGRVEKYKGLQYFLEAAVEVSRHGTQCDFLVVGRGQFSAREQELIKQLPSLVLENSWLSPLSLYSQVVRADVLVLPYIEATQSGVLSIAMALGIPVIASNVGGLPEFVINGKTGFLVSEKNAEEIAEKMKYFIKHNQLITEFSEETVRFAQVMSWERSIKLLIPFIESLYE